MQNIKNNIISIILTSILIVGVTYAATIPLGEKLISTEDTAVQGTILTSDWINEISSRWNDEGDNIHRDDGYVSIGNTTDNPGLLLGKSSNVSVAPDIEFDMQGLIAAQSNMFFNIDSDNDNSGTSFVFTADTDTSDNGNQLMVIEDSGRVAIFREIENTDSDTTVVTKKYVDDYMVIIEDVSESDIAGTCGDAYVSSLNSTYAIDKVRFLNTCGNRYCTDEHQGYRAGRVVEFSDLSGNGRATVQCFR